MATNNVQTLTIGGVTRQIEDVGARQLIASLQTALNTLTSGDTTTAIESFNEIIAFLENVSDSSTLQGIIAGLNTTIAGKVDKVTGKGLSTNDFTNELLTKLNSLSNYNDTALQTAVSNLQTALQNVYTKSQTYSKSEVDAAVASAQGTQGPKGDTGNVEITDAGDLVTILVNDLDTGGAGNLLSAEMGKRLALKSGTYAQAWARSKAIPFPFCFLWNETVDGDAISKPIWHKGNSVFIDAAGAIVSVEAASVPDAPTITGATSGSTVPKNTQIIITPASGSALYYSLDGGTTYNVSDAAVTVTLGTAGSVSIVAYCANNKGNSSNATLNVTVAGTAVPTFSPDGGEVSRGGSVTISVPTGGELHYKVDSGSWTTASGTSISIPITGATTIQAYNVQDGDTSDTITKSFTLAALASPTFSVATGTEFPIGGGSVSLNQSQGADIYYTTDGSTPTDQSTLYSGAIAVSVATTIKAVAKDNYGYSEVKTASYSVAVDHKFQFKIKLTGNNSTEYIPVTGIYSPQYTMSVDWGDESPVENYTNQRFNKKGLSHQYSGSEGDEYTITLRGTAIPVLVFAAGATSSEFYNIGSLVEIIENSLECDTQFVGNNNYSGGFTNCANLEAISADALQNNTYNIVSFGKTALTTLPSGLLTHLVKSSVTSFRPYGLFDTTSIVLTETLFGELKQALAKATSLDYIFYAIKVSNTIPDDLFDNIPDGVLTSVSSACQGANNSGDAKALYDVLVNKVTSSATTKLCFSSTSLSNRNQVPTSWGGTMS